MTFILAIKEIRIIIFAIGDNYMNKTIGFLILPIVTTLLSGCTGIHRNISNLFFPPYPNSDQREGEDTKLTLDETGGTCFAPLVAAAPVAAAAVEFAVKEVEKFLQDEAKRYTAAYSSSVIGDHFYNAGCGGDKIALKKISLARNTQRYNSNTDAAMELDLEVQPVSDGTAFQINPSRVALRQSKAKVAAIDITRPFGFDILAPWTIFQTFASFGNGDGFWPLRPAKVDMKVEITLHGVWIDKDQKGHAELIASRTFGIPRVEIGECRTFKKPGAPSLPASSCAIGNGISIINQNDYLAEWKKELFPAVPKSWKTGEAETETKTETTIEKDKKSEVETKIVKEKKYQSNPIGHGNYIVSVLITEVDNFGERVTEIGNAVKDNEGTITKGLTKFFE
jgi:hypothetical protein